MESAHEEHADHKVWETPRLRTDEDEGRHRKATWLELFFDLVYVVAIAQLSHGLAHEVDLRGIASFIILFVPIFWLWISSTIYNDRFETDDVGHRVFTFLQMVPVIGLATVSHHAMGEGGRWWALLYAAGRCLIVILWLRGGMYNPAARPTTTRYAIGFTTSIILFVVSAFVETDARYVLWAIALVIDFGTPLTTVNVQKRLPRYSTSHLPERFGLFTIIVIGESISGTVAALADREELTWENAATAALALVLAAAIWWTYFDLISRRPARPGLLYGFAKNYLHLPLVIAITAVGAGVFNVVGHESEEIFAATRVLVAASLGVALLCIALISKVAAVGPEAERGTRRSETAILLAGSLCIVLAGLRLELTPVQTLGILAGVLTLVVASTSLAWTPDEAHETSKSA